MEVLSGDQASLLTVTEKGYGKRTRLSQFRLQNRGGSGIKTAKVTKKTGQIVSSKLVDQSTTDLILTSTQGQTIRMKISGISSVGRATQGVRVMKLEDNEVLAAASVLGEEVPTENK